MRRIVVLFESSHAYNNICRSDLKIADTVIGLPRATVSVSAALLPACTKDNK